jgi:hypothetical protein
MHSQIQYWRDNEAKKIHEAYEVQREDILGEAFTAGLTGCNKSDSVMQDINSRHNNLYQQEIAAVKGIYDKADKYEQDRLDKLEAERKADVQIAWDNYYRRMGINKR